MRANLIALASCLWWSVSAVASDDPATMLHMRVEPSRDRQVVEGFGGYLAYWAYNERTAINLRTTGRPTGRTSTLPMRDSPNR